MGNLISSTPEPRYVRGAAKRTGRPHVDPQPLPQPFLDGLKEVVTPDGEKIYRLIQFPGTKEYEVNNICWNYDAAGSPSCIFVPKTKEDISAFLKFYSTHGPLPQPHSLSISGGRHSHYGLKNHSIVLDMQNFKSMEINDEKKTGKYGAGLKLSEFDAFNKSHGLATTAGTNPDTGIAGLTLGGGFGYLVRRHGMSVDNLLSVEVVLANGDIVTATADNEHSDLLYGCKGGGGNFGVVTSFEYQLYPRGDVINGAMVFLTRKFTNVQSVMEEWRDYAEKAPNDIMPMAIFPTGGPMVLAGSYVGDDLDEGEKLLKDYRKIGGAMINSFSRQPYCGAEKVGKDLQSSAAEHQIEGNWYEVAVALKELSNDAIKVLLNFSGPEIPNKISQFVVCRLGGKMEELSIDSAPVGIRKAKYIVMVLGRWEDTNGNVEEYNKLRAESSGWVKKVVKELGPYTMGGYNTLGDEELDEVKRQALTGEAASASVDKLPHGDLILHWNDKQSKRLHAIKYKYDPLNIFRNNNNILPIAPK